MKTTIETLEFPCEFKKKLKMKASLGNLSISFTSGHLIKINNDIALKIKSVNNTIERSYYKINVSLLNGGFTPVNEDEFTLKYEKR